ASISQRTELSSATPLKPGWWSNTGNRPSAGGASLTAMVLVAIRRSNAAVSAGVRYAGSLPTVSSLTTATQWRESRFANGGMSGASDDASRYCPYSIGFASVFLAGYQTQMRIGRGLWARGFVRAVGEPRAHARVGAGVVGAS